MPARAAASTDGISERLRCPKISTSLLPCQSRRPVTISNLEADDVNLRLFGDFAIVHARTTFTGVDGRAGSGRYTDVWARQNGRWLAISAHVTRLAS